jgi:hypothetical protein
VGKKGAPLVLSKQGVWGLPEHCGRLV